MSALPTISHPIISIEIPSTHETRTFRPYLVKEEKILLIASESKNLGEYMIAIMQVIQNCDIKGTLDATKLSMLDVEWVFIKLRASSVNNIVTQIFTDNEDNSKHKIDIDLNEVKIIYPEGHSNKIIINEHMGLIMKYPGINKKVFNDTNKVNQLVNVIKESVDKLWNNEEIYSFKDHTEEEVDAFLDQLPPSFYSQFREFIATIPRLNYDITFTNTKGVERKIVLSTLQDFFNLV